MSMVWIAGQTVGAGGAASVTFSSIPQTFTHLQVRVFMRDAQTFGTYDNLYYRLNGDAGSNYSNHRLLGDGTSAYSYNYTSQTFVATGTNPSINSTANVFGVSIIDFLDYTNTNKYKTSRSISGFDGNGSGFVSLDSGLWMSTSAITSILLGGQNSGATPVQYTRVDLYGITSSQVTGA